MSPPRDVALGLPQRHQDTKVHEGDAVCLSRWAGLRVLRFILNNRCVNSIFSLLCDEINLNSRLSQQNIIKFHLWGIEGAVKH